MSQVLSRNRNGDSTVEFDPIAEDIIGRFGTLTELAAISKWHYQTLYKWLLNGIPPHNWRALIALAEDVGVELSAEDFLRTNKPLGRMTGAERGA